MRTPALGSFSIEETTATIPLTCIPPKVKDAMTNVRKLTIDIIARCMAHCPKCPLVDGQPRVSTMSLEEFKVKTASYGNYDIIRISGGEPFENPDLMNMVEHAHAMGKKVEILTSGLIQGRQIDQFTLQHLKGKASLIIAYDGYLKDFDPSLQPQMRLGNDFHQEVVDTAEFCACNNIPLSFQTVLIDENLRMAEDIVQDIALLNQRQGSRIEARKIPEIGIHFIRNISDGRGMTGERIPESSETIGILPETFEALSRKYGVRITWSTDVSLESHHCGGMNVKISGNDVIIPCGILIEPTQLELPELQNLGS